MKECSCVEIVKCIGYLDHVTRPQSLHRLTFEMLVHGHLCPIF